MLFLALILVSSIAAGSAQSCDPEYDSYFADPQQCDRYTQCIGGVPHDQLCPDGLVYNERNEYPAYPCSYITEVDCSSRSQLQPAQPTQNCGRAWGYFGSGDRADCGHFFNCVEGRAFEVQCPDGLVFDSITYTCSWPELASLDCDIEAYFGFSCPEPQNKLRVLIEGHARYSSPKDCRKFFLCEGVSPRLHSCELGTVFNQETNGCDEPENVQGCSSYYPADELAAIRARKEARLVAQQERQAALLRRLQDRQANIPS